MDIETDVIEYALGAWIVISIAAFIIQLVRRRRYRRAVGPDRGDDSITTTPGALTITRASEPDDTLSETADQPSEASKEPSETAEAAESTSDGESELDASETEVPTGRRPGAIAEPTSETSESTAADPDLDLTKADPAASANESQTSDSHSNDTADAMIDLDADGEGGEVEDTEPAPVTISDLLGGVRLPADLLPLDTGQTDYAVRFSTTGFDPADVGTALADELERLGYEIVPKAEDEAKAVRDDQVLSLKIHDRTDKVEVDVWVGEIPNPFDRTAV